MPKGRDLVAIAILLLLLANAASVLLFRYFITLDGPVHVLRAAVLEAHWSTPRYVADGIAYDASRVVPQLGDLMLMGLLHVASPEGAQSLYASLVLCIVCGSALWLVRSMSGRIELAALWLAPLAFGVPLILGFLSFLLSVGLCMIVTAWWVARPRIRAQELLLAAAAMWVTFYTHRGAPLMLVSMVLVCEGVAYIRSAPGHLQRWGVLPRRVIIPVAVVLIITGGLLTARAIASIPQMPSPREQEFTDLFALRPLLLLNAGQEKWSLIALGALLLLSLGAGLRTRWRMGRALQRSDALWILGLLLLLAPLILDTPRSRQLFFQERAHWIGLLLLAVWMACLPRSRMITFAAIVLLPVQAFRLVDLERSLAPHAEEHRQMLEVASHLSPGSVVVPIITNGNWLLQHMGAYVAVRHPGILFTRQDHMNFLFADPPIEAVRQFLQRMSADRSWLEKHVQSGLRPRIAHIMLIGGDAHLRAVAMAPMADLIEERYWKTADNGFATLYTLDPEGIKPQATR